MKIWIDVCLCWWDYPLSILGHNEQNQICFLDDLDRFNWTAQNDLSEADQQTILTFCKENFNYPSEQCAYDVYPIQLEGGLKYVLIDIIANEDTCELKYQVQDFTYNLFVIKETDTFKDGTHVTYDNFLKDPKFFTTNFREKYTTNAAYITTQYQSTGTIGIGQIINWEDRRKIRDERRLF